MAGGSRRPEQTARAGVQPPRPARSPKPSASIIEVTEELQSIVHAIAKEAGVPLVAIPRVPISKATTFSEILEARQRA